MNDKYQLPNKNDQPEDVKVAFEKAREAVYIHKDYVGGLPLAQKALKKCREVNWTAGIGRTLVFIGTCYKLRSEYDTALKYMFEAIDLYQSPELKKNLAYTKNSIGNVY